MTKQPITTAPRDGTVVLLFGGTTDEIVYDWSAVVDTGRPVTGFWVSEVCDGESDSWNEDTGEYEHRDWWAVGYWDGDWRTGYVNPTHWMEIP